MRFSMTESQIHRLDDHFLSELSSIDTWLSRLGIRKHNRFRRYQQNIEWLMRHDEPADRSRIYAELRSQGKLSEVLSSYVESIEIVETIPALRDNAIDIPIELLRKAFSGSADAMRETSRSNQARNAMFELNIAAMIARQGLDPALSNRNPDVSFNFANRAVHVECKRVISRGKLFERIEEGVRQLDKSVDVVKKEIGIVAVSLSKLVAPSDHIFTATNGHPHDMVSRTLYLLLRQIEQPLGRLVRPHASAILFYAASPALVPSFGYTRASSSTLFPLDLADQAYLLKLANTLKG